MRILGIAGISLILLLSACTGPRQPDWTTGRGQGYPQEEWIVGIGIDRDRGRAEDRARAGIAKTFQVEIQALDTSSESYRLSKVGKVAADEYRQAVGAELTARTGKVLAGVRVAEVWQDPRSGEYHALAVLERRPTARFLRDEIRDLDERLNDLVAWAAAAPSAPRRLGLYLQALQLLEQRRLLAADLRVADVAGRAAEPPFGTAEIAGRIDREAGAIRLGLQLEEEPPAIVQGALVRALAEIGILQAAGGAQNLICRGQVTTEGYLHGPLHWSTASVQLELVDGDGTILDSLRASVREGSQVAGRAEVLARERLGERLAALVIERLGHLGEGK